MLSLRVENITVEFDRDGRKNYARTGLVNWFGKPVFILFDSYAFNFDLEGRIWRIDGFMPIYSWDWIQRTMANDWIYYDNAWNTPDFRLPAPVIGDAAWPVNGRTDLPMLHDHDGLQRECVVQALKAFDELIPTVRDLVNRKPEAYAESGETASAAQAERLWLFLEKVARNDRAQLQATAGRLKEIHGGMEVLPPDTIGVDYKVLPIRVMDGCPHACGFCMARGTSPFALRSEEDIDRQIEALAKIYGEDLYNYNAVVLGECDALTSPFLEYAATKAFDAFAVGRPTTPDRISFSLRQTKPYANNRRTPWIPWMHSRSNTSTSTSAGKPPPTKRCPNWAKHRPERKYSSAWRKPAG